MSGSRRSTPSSQSIRAALYIRSAWEVRPGSPGHANSQLTLLQAFAQEKEWTLQGVYQDIRVSGLKEDRPGLNKLLEACRGGHIDVVVVTDVARLSRSIGHCLSLLRQFRKLKVDLISTNDVKGVPISNITEERNHDSGLQTKTKHQSI